MANFVGVGSVVPEKPMPFPNTQSVRLGYRTDSPAGLHFKVGPGDWTPLAYADFRDVREYDVVGDGVTDDTAALQAALDAGGTVGIPASFNCLVSGVRFTSDYTNLISFGGTITGSAVNIRIVFTNGHHHCSVRGLKVVGTGKDSGGTSSGRGAIHIGDNDQYNEVVGNTILTANGTGIVDDGLRSLVAFNQIFETGEHGIYCSGAIGSMYIGNYIKDAGKNSALNTPNTMIGFRYSSCVGCTAIGNTIEDTASAGASLAGYGVVFEGPSTNCVFSGNIVRHSRTYEIEIGTGSYNTVTDNQFISNSNFANLIFNGGGRNTVCDNQFTREAGGAQAIVWQAASSNTGRDTVCGNTIYSAQDHSGYAAILINDVNADECLLEGNVVLAEANWAYGIDVAASVERTRIGSNVLLATTPIRDNGDNTIITWVRSSAYLDWDPPSIASGASAESADVTTTALVGDRVEASWGSSLQGMTVGAYVRTTNAVRVVISNLTGGAIDLASGRARVTVYHGTK